MRILVALAASLCLIAPASADPIHANANGDYWHHDSGWVFPRRCGEFERVGAAQDVAGTRDAVAYYAREIAGVRETVAVEVLAQDSAADESATQILRLESKGEWRVRIRMVTPAAVPTVTQALTDFVQAQRWDTLGTLH